MIWINCHIITAQNLWGFPQLQYVWTICGTSMCQSLEKLLWTQGPTMRPSSFMRSSSPISMKPSKTLRFWYEFNWELWVFSFRIQNETITMENPNHKILSSMLALDFMPTFIPQQYVGAARCDDKPSATGLSACDIFQCVVYDPPGMSRPGYDDSVSEWISGP